MPEKFVRVNGTNDVNIEINATGDTTIFLPAEGGTLAYQGGVPGAIAAAGSTITSGTINFSNSNNVSFGANGQTITASATFAQSNQNISFFALGNTTQNSSTNLGANAVSYNGLGIITVGFSNGSIQISASQTVQTQNMVSVNGSTGNISFQNGNNVTFGFNASTVTASASFNQTNQNISFFALGNTTQNSSSVLNANAVSFNAIGSLTVGYSNGSIQLSAPNALTTQSGQAFSAGAASSAFQTLSFQDSNGVSFSNNAGAIRLTHDLQYTSNTSNITSAALHTSASRVINVVAATNNAGGGTASVSGNVSFSNANNHTFYTSAGGAIVVSYSQSNQNISLYALGNTTQNSSTQLNASNLSFNGLGNISVGYSNGSIQISGAGGGGGTISFFALGNTTQNSSTSLNANAVSFNAIGSLTVGYSNGSIQLSAPNALTTARASNDGIGTNTAQTNVTWTVNSGGLSLNAAGYAGTGTTFNGANISASMTNNSNGLQLSMSVAAPGAAAEANWVNLLGANTAGNTTASGSTIGWSAGNNITLSGTNGSQIVISALSYANSNGITFGTNAGTLTASHNGMIGWELEGANTAGTTSSAQGSQLYLSGGNNVTLSGNSNTIIISAGAGGAAAATRSFFNPYGDNAMVAGQVGQGTMNINPNDFPNCTFDRVYMPINITNSSNSSGSHTLSFWLGIYTRNVSTLSLVTSQSTSYALTHSGTAGSYSLYSGMRHISMGISTSLAEGLYYLAIISRTTSGGANGSYSQFVISNINSNFLGHFSSSHNTTYQFRPGYGVYSVTTSGIPNSIGISQIRGSDSAGFRPPGIIFANSTI